MTSRNDRPWRGDNANRGTAWQPSKGGQTPRNKGVCHAYQRGNCRYGASCKFSHDLSRESGKGSLLSTKDVEDITDDKQDYLDWKRLLRRGRLSQLDEQRVLDIWTGVIPILDGESRQLQQSVAKDLVDEDLGGHHAIRTTMQICDNHDDDIRSLALSNIFFKVITHPALLDSMSVDSFVGSIYRFVGGVNGEEGIMFLTDVLQRMTQVSKGSTPTAVDLPSALLATLEFMDTFFRRERRSLLNDRLTGLFKTVKRLIARLHGMAPCTKLELASVRLEVMNRMLAAAHRLFSGTTKNPMQALGGQIAQVQSTFPLAIVVPGGNHDNDFADLNKIQIIPTPGEISSGHPEFLPSTDLLQPHFLSDPIQRHLDCAFRLLRHDIFGPLKAVLSGLLSQEQATDTVNPNHVICGNVLGHVYVKAFIKHLSVREKAGLEATISFTAPPQVKRLNLREQRRWWDESSRLEQGSLVSFVTSNSGEKSLLFFIVTVKNTEGMGRRRDKEDFEPTLVSENTNPTLSLKLTSETRENVALLAHIYAHRIPGQLIELPGIIPGTFVPVLKSLQRMFQNGELPFHRWILPSPTNHQLHQDKIPPPAYTRQPGFSFHLDCIATNGTGVLTLNPNAPDDLDYQTLESRTGLDRAQCLALAAALTREYSQIQGPPGTGKSHVGVQVIKVLLHHKAQAKLGPIIIQCYTNHALDQFLKHLKDIGVNNMIRVGGQCKDKELEGKNLRLVPKAQTPMEGYILGKTYEELNTCLKQAGIMLKPIHQAQRAHLDWSSLEGFLTTAHPRISAQFQQVDEDGFTHRDVSLLTNPQRHALVEGWLGEMTEQGSDRLFDYVDEAKRLRSTIDGVHADTNRRALLQADIIGVTTTGLARNIDILRLIKPKVMLCEEAAEVLEPHLISSFIPGLEHVIQIGDHRQLRPQIQNYLQFSIETQRGQAYQLDRSQFERRAVGEPGLAPIPVAQLKIQRRMRPEISRLIRSVYPDLEDHDCVKNLPSVVGMRHNLFWLDHSHPEDNNNDGMRVSSHSNSWEVEMTTALVRHLVRQGEYKSADVALLTPYAGQLQKLRAALNKDFEVVLSERDLETLAQQGAADTGIGQTSQDMWQSHQKQTLGQSIRIATVDNFQGEEAKVVIVSLVRSNANRKVGFLRTENRINVLLSRAKHGMYLIGNTSTYLNVDMWRDVHRQLTETDAVGDAIALCCPRHPDTRMHCLEPQDFEKHSPEGGCNLPCDKRLEPCGHRCQTKCHSDVLHAAFACPQPCPRIRTTCSHQCPLLCSDVCGDCKVLVSGVQLPCGHVKDRVPCHMTVETSRIQCAVQVEKQVPGCGHMVKMNCFRDVTSAAYRCPTKCNKLLSCGHVCPGTCGVCNKQSEDGTVVIQHQACTKVCGRPSSICNHVCTRRCHDGEGCGGCTKSCEVRCPHSSCSLGCRDPCAPCVEECTWSCSHKGSCSLPCAAPCNRLPCDERCDQTLTCGHQCPSFCGEDCPQDLCQICCVQKDARVDLLEFKTFAEVDLNEFPIVQLSCKHFFTGETLDGLVGMDDVYTTDRAGQYNGLKDLSVALSGGIPACPDCKRPIRQFATKRYNRVVNRAVMDETSKRFLVEGSRRLEELEKELVKVEDKLRKPPKESITAGITSHNLERLRFVSVEGRYAEGLSLEKEAGRVREAMNIEHQPMKRLNDAIVTLRRRRNNSATLEEEMRSLTILEKAQNYEKQVTMGARMIQLKVQEMMLRDKFNLLRKSRVDTFKPLPGGMPDKLATLFLQSCKKFVAEAAEAKLPRLAMPAILAYARVAQLDDWYWRNAAHRLEGANSVQRKCARARKQDRETARALLDNAATMCAALPNSKELMAAIEEMKRLYEGSRYEDVTPEELAAIKTAMVSGRGGIATHSGHWYNCANGHPFAIGECGMPMEEARCPECGARIGGHNHTAVEGVSRAFGMESA
ncbi:hypothetical protein B0T22DRAFT_427646 [Podospora appendiculata]|uniref:NFX1-type zinc finger-containing protein 1 n=1 Tax=Podospora appendiculata TaxID=314037 RepID=A0AAE0XBE7_9PEZI|nr:hypothetical protein B0T22DRAFT_427646 [Podospora appendiculata]